MAENDILTPKVIRAHLETHDKSTKTHAKDWRLYKETYLTRLADSTGRKCPPNAGLA